MAFLSFDSVTREHAERFRTLREVHEQPRRARLMTAFKSGDPLTLNRLYGRSSGHKLRQGQQELIDRLLPQLEIPADGELTAPTCCPTTVSSPSSRS
jgi:hypothetical protein